MCLKCIVIRTIFLIIFYLIIVFEKLLLRGILSMRKKLLIYLGIFPILAILAIKDITVKDITFEDVKNIKNIDVNEITKQEKKRVLEDKRIVLDPGHGGNDIGASGQNGTIEKEVTLETAKKIKAALEQAGAEVLLTRDDDE